MELKDPDPAIPEMGLGVRGLGFKGLGFRVFNSLGNEWSTKVVQGFVYEQYVYCLGLGFCNLGYRSIVPSGSRLPSSQDPAYNPWI